MAIYIATGGLQLLNCAIISQEFIVDPLYPTGSLVYIRKTALTECKYEKVCIKEVHLRDGEILNYEDTFNRVWLEEELCNFTQATTNIKICKLRKDADAIKGLKQKCSNSS